MHPVFMLIEDSRGFFIAGVRGVRSNIYTYIHNIYNVKLTYTLSSRIYTSEKNSDPDPVRGKCPVADAHGGCMTSISRSLSSSLSLSFCLYR